MARNWNQELKVNGELDKEVAGVGNSETIDLKFDAGYAVQAVWTDETPAATDFVDGDVDTGADTITETAHGYETGLAIQLTTTGTLPAPLATATTYYVIKVDDDTYQLASSSAQAEGGTQIDITSAAGGGTHTLTPTAGLTGTIKLQASLDGTTYADVPSSDVTITGPSDQLWNNSLVFYTHARLRIDMTTGQGKFSVRAAGHEY